MKAIVSTLVVNTKKDQERRLYRRYETALPVSLINEQGEALEAQTGNLSLGGVQVHCDRHTLSLIAPKGEKTTPDQAPMVRLKFRLPVVGGKEPEIEADCKVVLIRRFSEMEYHLHMQYEFFHANGYNELEDFIQAMTDTQA